MDKIPKDFMSIKDTYYAALYGFLSADVDKSVWV